MGGDGGGGPVEVPFVDAYGGAGRAASGATAGGRRGAGSSAGRGHRRGRLASGPGSAEQSRPELELNDVRREVRMLGALGAAKKKGLDAITASGRKRPRIPPNIGVGIWKKQQKKLRMEKEEAARRR